MAPTVCESSRERLTCRDSDIGNNCEIKKITFASFGAENLLSELYFCNKLESLFCVYYEWNSCSELLTQTFTHKILTLKHSSAYEIKLNLSIIRHRTRRQKKVTNIKRGEVQS